jgi:hypothetical protein
MPSQAELATAFEDGLKSARNARRVLVVTNLDFVAVRNKIETRIRSQLGTDLSPEFRWPPSNPRYTQQPHRHTGTLFLVFSTRDATKLALSKLRALSFGGRNASVQKASRVAVSA